MLALRLFARFGYVPTMLGGLNLLAVYVVAGGYSIIWIGALFAVAIALSLLSERALPFEQSWNTAHSDVPKDVAHGIVYELFEHHRHLDASTRHDGYPVGWHLAYHSAPGSSAALGHSHRRFQHDNDSLFESPHDLALEASLDPSWCAPALQLQWFVTPPHAPVNGSCCRYAAPGLGGSPCKSRHLARFRSFGATSRAALKHRFRAWPFSKVAGRWRGCIVCTT